jgi:uncharacterized membrane protein
MEPAKVSFSLSYGIQKKKGMGKIVNFQRFSKNVTREMAKKQAGTLMVVSFGEIET